MVKACDMTVEQTVIATASQPPGPGESQPLRVVPVRHLGRWIGAAAILVLIAMLIHSFVSNHNYEWGIVGHYLFNHTVLIGLTHTIELTVTAMGIGIALGIILAVMRLSPNPLISGVSGVYIWFFRGTPLIVQLLFWYYLGALIPRMGIGLPFGPTFASAATNVLISQYAAAMLGLSMNEGAYMAEIVRAGIIAVHPGQKEAAFSLGMTNLQTMRRVVLPQAMRVIIPPMGNETISMLKNTSLVIVIAYGELLTSVQLIYARTFQNIPLLIVACIWYLLLTTALSMGQRRIEAHFGRGSANSTGGYSIQGVGSPITALRRAFGRLGWGATQ
jgi:polar amino acid transport system permease protein